MMLVTMPAALVAMLMPVLIAMTFFSMIFYIFVFLMRMITTVFFIHKDHLSFIYVKLCHVQNEANVLVGDRVDLILTHPNYFDKICSLKNGKLMRYR